jgi:RNA polymerase-interacting CarD/CdnL/TRCF family regulator
MRFKIGDYVVHLAHGLGQIVNLEKKHLSGGEARLYYEVVTQKSTVWVPVQTESEGTLRSLTAKSELAHYQQILKRKPEALNADRRLRLAELNERLKQGSFQALCEVVRDLTAHGWRKPLSDSDAALLRRISDNLCQEWAAAAGVTVVEASQLITALMFETKRAYATT